MGETLELTIGDATFDAYATGDAGPGLVVVHEWYGLNDSVREIANRFGEEGFRVLAPDLYGGELAEDDAAALALMTAMQTERSVAVIEACGEALRARGAGKVGVTGFCMGGAMAFAAASLESVAAVVPFYGSARADYMRAERIDCPIQAHFAEHDVFVKPGAAITLAREIRAQGGRMELHFYDAGHAFMRRGDEQAYDEAAATLAWSRALEFLRAELR